MRVKRLRISPECFLYLFHSGVHNGDYDVIADGVPKDAKAINVVHGYPHCIEVLISSDSFAEVGDGEVIPELIPVLRTLQPA